MVLVVDESTEYERKITVRRNEREKVDEVEVEDGRLVWWGGRLLI